MHRQFEVGGKYTKQYLSVITCQYLPRAGAKREDCDEDQG